MKTVRTTKPAATGKKPAPAKPAAEKKPAAPAMTSASARKPIAPADVHATLARHMLADGYDLVLDLEKSRGRRLWDARANRSLLHSPSGA